MRGIMTHVLIERPDLFDSEAGAPAVMPDGTAAYWVGMLISRDEWRTHVGDFTFDPIEVSISKETTND